nr:hypothetical protein [Tanacetum cinerariifolium]
LPEAGGYGKNNCLEVLMLLKLKSKIFRRKDNVYVRWSPGRSSESDLQVHLTNVDLSDCKGFPVVNVDEPAFALCGYQVVVPVFVNMDTPAA